MAESTYLPIHTVLTPLRIAQTEVFKTVVLSGVRAGLDPQELERGHCPTPGDYRIWQPLDKGLRATSSSWTSCGHSLRTSLSLATRSA